MSEPGVGPRVGRYELRGILGRGGFAEVFRAYDPLLGREVALKALLPHHAADPEVRARFLDEARKIARLRHPNIVTVHDVGEEAGRPYFTMELVDGPTLEKLIGQGRGGLPPERALALLGSLASAVEYLHGAGIIHRDLKASNVMLDSVGRLVLMDFGIARAIDQTAMTTPGLIIGTPMAMAPEQLRGEPVGAPADIYALGVLAFQVFSGRLPFAGDTARVLHAHAYEPPPPLRDAVPGLPDAVYATVASALAKYPGERPASAAAFAAALTGAATPPSLPPLYTPPAEPTMAGPLPAVDQAGPTLVTPQPPPTVPLLPPRPERQRSVLPLVGGVAAVLVLAALIGGGIVFTRGQNSDDGSDTASARTTVTAIPAGGAAATIATTGGSAATSPTAAPTTATPSPTAVLAEALNLVVYNGASHAASGEFPPEDGIEVCFTLRPGRGETALHVLATRFDRQPRDENDSAVVARSGPLPREGGDRCEGMPFVGGAPGPGQYWVWVMDGANAVGRGDFRLLAPRPTATPTPSPTPPRVQGTPAPPALDLPPSGSGTNQPRLAITSVRSLGRAVAGQEFVFEVTAANSGANGMQGGISVSAPGLSVLQGAVGACAVPTRIDTLRPGEQATGFDPSGRVPLTRITLTAPLVELAFVGQWPTGVSCRLLVRVTAPASGEMTFLLRVATRNGAGGFAIWPYGSGAEIATDQQGLPAIRWTVPVERP